MIDWFDALWLIIVKYATAFSAKHFNFKLAVCFIGEEKSEYQGKTADLPQVTDKLSHNDVTSTSHHVQESYFSTLLVVCTVVISRCKSIYHTISATEYFLCQLYWLPVPRFSIENDGKTLHGIPWSTCIGMHFPSFLHHKIKNKYDDISYERERISYANYYFANTPVPLF